MQLCGAGACHALREQLCVRRWTPPCHDMVDEDSELACQFHTQGQGNGIGELLDGEPIALEDIILDGSCGEAVRARFSKVARARSSRLDLLVWAQSSFFEFGVEPSTMSLKFARRWRKYKALLANSGRSVVNETPVMMARETFLERMYRFNICCYQDWPILEPMRPRPHNGRRYASSSKNLCQVSKGLFQRSPRRSVWVWRMGGASSLSTSWMPT